MKSASGVSIGAISSVPALASDVLLPELGAGRIDQRLHRGDLREEADFDRGGVGVGELQLVGRVEHRLQGEGLDGRPLEAQRLAAVGFLAGRLDLQAAGQVSRNCTAG